MVSFKEVFLVSEFSFQQFEQFLPIAHGKLSTDVSSSGFRFFSKCERFLLIAHGML